jgi:uncharacterized membrane protein YphA (DoxX/SURF4 family)
MKIMQDSMAQPRMDAALDLAAWKNIVAIACALVLAVIFLVAGGWKTLDPFGASARLSQAKVPGWLAMPGTITLGALEVFSAILILIPRFRRWGALLIGAMMVFFMGWVGYYYEALTGAECSCFPWVKRAVGPGFFVGDGIMLLMAVPAYIWAKPSAGLKQAAMILGGVAVFAAASYGVAFSQNNGAKAPDTLTVDGKTTAINAGRVFLFFYDPECAHCDEAARRMATWNWKDTKVIGVPTRVPQFGKDFMQSTKLNAGNSSDVEALKKIFPFGDPPYGVSLENGRQKAGHVIFDKTQPEADLKSSGFIE